jgi:hypothetical protein
LLLDRLDVWDSVLGGLVCRRGVSSGHFINVFSCGHGRGIAMEGFERNVMGVDGGPVCGETGSGQSFLILHQGRIITFIDSVIGSSGLTLVLVLFSGVFQLFSIKASKGFINRRLFRLSWCDLLGLVECQRLGMLDLWLWHMW